MFELLAALADAGVDFVVIGGVAVGFHGYVRATKDLDVIPAPDPANLERLWEALVAIEASPTALDLVTADELPVAFSREALVERGGNWLLHTRLGRLDVMQWVAGVDAYEALAATAVRVTLPQIGAEIAFAGLEQLLAMKTAAGRDQDLADIAALRSIGDRPG
jgi:predicted nucleotidyltransferase